MNIRSLLFIVCIGACSLLIDTGCRNKDKYRNELAELDSISKKMSTILGATQAVDSLPLIAKTQEVLKDLAQADTLLPDTIKDKGLAILLMEYRALVTPLRQYPYKMKELHRQAAEFNTRIAGLRNDLSKQVADEKQVPGYMGAEKLNAEHLSRSYDVLNGVKDKSLKKADSLSQIMKSKIRELTILKSQEKKKK
jgi:hypothetical protein